MLNHSTDNWINIIKVEFPNETRYIDEWYASPAYKENVDIRDEARAVLIRWFNNSHESIPSKKSYENQVLDVLFMHIDFRTDKQFTNAKVPIHKSYRTLIFMDTTGDIDWEIGYLNNLHSGGFGTRELATYPIVMLPSASLGSATDLAYTSVQIRGKSKNTSYERTLYYNTGWHDILVLGDASNNSAWTESVCQSSFIAMSEEGAESYSQEDGVKVCILPSEDTATNGDYVVVLHMYFIGASPDKIGFPVMNFVLDMLNAPKTLVGKYIDDTDTQQVVGGGHLQTDVDILFTWAITADGLFSSSFSPYSEIVDIPPPTNGDDEGLWEYLMPLIDIYQNREGEHISNQFKKFGVDFTNNKVLEYFKWTIMMVERYGDFRIGDHAPNTLIQDIIPDTVRRIFENPTYVETEEQYNTLKRIHRELSDGQDYNKREWDGSIVGSRKPINYGGAGA